MEIKCANRCGNYVCEFEELCDACKEFDEANAE